MPPIIKKQKQKLCKTPEQWREWLEKNHAKEDSVLLVRYKRPTGKPTFNQREAMDVAICFGWIDTTVHRIDDEKYAMKFVKRKKTSRWSNATQARARAMIREKRMTPAGLKAFKEGLKKSLIDLALPKNLGVPEDLKKALARSKKAAENFANFAPSYRRQYIYWIERAKRPETRKRRIKEVYRKARDNEKQ